MSNDTTWLFFFFFPFACNLIASTKWWVQREGFRENVSLANSISWHLRLLAWRALMVPARLLPRQLSQACWLTSSSQPSGAGELSLPNSPGYEAVQSDSLSAMIIIRGSVLLPGIVSLYQQISIFSIVTSFLEIVLHDMPSLPVSVWMSTQQSSCFPLLKY